VRDVDLEPCDPVREDRQQRALARVGGGDAAARGPVTAGRDQTRGIQGGRGAQQGSEGGRRIGRDQAALANRREHASVRRCVLDETRLVRLPRDSPRIPDHAPRLKQKMRADSKPARAPGFLVSSLDDEVLLSRPDATAAMYMNATAGLIWALCDGGHTVAEITSLLSEAYPEAGGRIADDVRDTLAELRERGAVLDDWALPARRDGSTLRGRHER
jgi:hypothetical protein